MVAAKRKVNTCSAMRRDFGRFLAARDTYTLYRQELVVAYTATVDMSVDKSGRLWTGKGASHQHQNVHPRHRIGVGVPFAERE